MSVPVTRIKEIMAGRHQSRIALLSGLSVGALVATAFIYFPVRSGRLADGTAVVIAGTLLLGWLAVAAGMRKSSRNAESLATILDAENPRATYDRSGGKLVFEQVERMDLGMGDLTEAITNRAEVSLQEAQLIGLEMDVSRRRPLLQQRSVASTAIRPRDEGSSAASIPVPTAS